MLSAETQTIAWMVIFFFASAAASSAYLTVSESFPLEIRALAIAFFYAVGTGIGGVAGPVAVRRADRDRLARERVRRLCSRRRADDRGGRWSNGAGASPPSAGRSRPSRGRSPSSIESRIFIERPGEDHFENPTWQTSFPTSPIVLGETAILLDIDGTLLNFAPTPREVLVPPTLRVTLQRLWERTGGAVALVSGRSLDDIALLFAPLELPAIGGHGAEFCPYPGGDAEAVRLAAARSGRQAQARGGARARPRRHSRGQDAIRSPSTTGSRPTRRRRCVRPCTPSAPAFPPGLVEILPGNKVIEVKQSGFDKGTAVRGTDALSAVRTAAARSSSATTPPTRWCFRSCRSSTASAFRSAGGSTAPPDASTRRATSRAGSTGSRAKSRSGATRRSTHRPPDGLPPEAPEFPVLPSAARPTCSRAGQIERAVDQARHARRPAENFRPAACCAGSYSSLSRPTSLQSANRRSNRRYGVAPPALQDVDVDEPEAAGEKRALARRQSVGVARCDSAARARRRAGRVRSPRSCRGCADRRSAENRPAASSSRLASSSLRAVGLRRSCRAPGQSRAAHTSVVNSPRAGARQSSTGPSRPNVSALLMARSNATQAITLE